MRIGVLLLLCVSAVAQTFSITNVTVVDGTGAPPRAKSTVTVSGDRIVAISSAPARGAKVIDGKGKYLIPGLWDMHVHLWDTESLFPMYVAAGVTGIRDMGSDIARTRKWAREDARAPRVYTSGPPLDGPGREGGKLKPVRVTSPDEARRETDRVDDMEVDFLKVLSALSRDTYMAIAHRARILRTPFAGHVPEGVSAWEALDQRQKSMEHLFGVLLACTPEEQELRQRRVDAIAKKDGGELRRIRERMYDTYDEGRAMEFFRRCARYGVWQCPTLTLRARMSLVGIKDLVSDPRVKYVPEAIRKTWTDPMKDVERASTDTLQHYVRDYNAHVKLVGAMKRAGVDILAGTDTGDDYVLPGFALHDELGLLVIAGLTPMEALQTATRNPARFFNIEKTHGTIERGKIADMVLLDGDPLADIRNTQKIRAVVLRGQFLSRERLDQMLTSRK